MKSACGLALVSLVLAAAPVKAVPILFTCLENNSGQCPALAMQITVDLTNPGSNRASFELENAGPIPSSVTAVYFDFASSLFTGFFSSTGTGTVDFPIDGTVSPPNVPGGNNAVPPFVSDLGIDSAPPAAPNGVNPMESLTLVLDLGGGNTFADVLTQLSSGDLRLALHVQAVGTGGQFSDSLISTPFIIPEPETYLTLIGGLFALGGFALKRRIAAC